MANDFDGWVQWYCFAAAKPYHPLSICVSIPYSGYANSTFSKLLTGTHDYAVESLHFHSPVISHGAAL